MERGGVRYATILLLLLIVEYRRSDLRQGGSGRIMRAKLTDAMGKTKGPLTSALLLYV